VDSFTLILHGTLPGPVHRVPAEFCFNLAQARNLPLRVHSKHLNVTSHRE
jgi:hypothetical protein